jgi:hypothetical protein
MFTYFRFYILAEWGPRITRIANSSKCFTNLRKADQVILLTELYENTRSKVITQNPLFNEQLLFKETKKVPESEIETSSESEDEIKQKITLRHEPEIIFIVDEKHQLDKLVLDHDKVYHSVNFGELLIKEMLMCSMFGVAMSTSAAIQGYRLQVERITRIADSSKCFTNLRKADQVILLKENADLLASAPNEQNSLGKQT